ncbi:hypothetical protein HFRIS_014005 [Herbaspirillum frisingense GSF30]|uniref:Secreted protein n=1 Tax=Herbaspirillum frisingense GSF30 TaxID=864073 RepID=A0AAI9IDV7_9BURK|nr:hypothetical protein HFRIS_014005 [Herbaspirillum frisingense GSF30]
MLPWATMIMSAVASMKAATLSPLKSGAKASVMAAMSRLPCSSGQGWRCSMASRTFFSASSRVAAVFFHSAGLRRYSLDISRYRLSRLARMARVATRLLSDWPISRELASAPLTWPCGAGELAQAASKAAQGSSRGSSVVLVIGGQDETS